MDNRILPVVRVPTIPAGEGDDVGGLSETPIVDLPSSEKFGFAFPDNTMITPVSSENAHSLPGGLEALDPDSSGPESQASRNSPLMTGRKDSADHTPTAEMPNLGPTPVFSPSPPRFSRAFSMPVPSQLRHLNNPHRTPTVNSKCDAYFGSPSPLVLADSPNSHVQELSVEVADSVQMVIQTLLQISPPHLLDPAKEQFSGCSLAVPSPSISAMLTAMKNLNYMSANMSRFVDDQSTQGDVSLRPELSLKSTINCDFDIGETLQNVGDALSGVAAQAGVELVLYHADVGMKHVSVRGDECGVSLALLHVIRQILDTTQPGDTLEVGLSITPETHDSREPGQNTLLSGNESRSSSRASSLSEYDGPLRCIFDVGHKFGSPEAHLAVEYNPHVTAGTSLFRAKPRLDTILFRRMLYQIGGIVKEDLQPRMFSPGRSCELSVVLESGSMELLSQPTKLSSEEQALRQPYASMNIQLASEPSLEDLLQFIDLLKGKKVVLHASAKGSFAHHLTSYLTAWGLDVSHMTVATSKEDASDAVSAVMADSMDDGARQTSSSVRMTDSLVPAKVDPSEERMREREGPESNNTSFIIIDDDVEALRSRLTQLRSEASFNLNLRYRPKLASHHRPKSSPQMQLYRTKGLKQMAIPEQSSIHPVIIHFTSLQNFKLIKDLIHANLSSSNLPIFIPEIIVLPKPAGPRRVLTALRTAVVKPLVDPFFSPTATSPASPNVQGVNPFSPFTSGGSPSQQCGRPSISPRTTSDRSLRASKEGTDFAQRLPPSPLRESDSFDYFAEEAVKRGTSSSGLIIQSPDGQPTGIFFHPRGAGSRQPSDNASAGPVVNPPNLVRDAGNLRPPGEHRRLNLQRQATTQVHDGDMPPGEHFSRPNYSRRDRSVSTYFDEPGSAALSETETPLHSPGHRWARIPGSPHEGLPALPQITNIGPSPPDDTMPGNEVHPRSAPPGAGIVERKSMSPSASAATVRAGPSKRNLLRRRAVEASQVPGAPTTRKGKPSADGNIVPPINVLIVEDNPINQTILSTFMRKKKIKYDVAKNGAEAVAKWKTGSFHLILMDIQMPVMDGIQATKEIRSLERQAAASPFASTPPPDGERTPSDAASSESKSTMSAYTPFRSSVIIVALTASSLQADRVAALAAGCNDFLTKPVSLLWLNNKIIEWGSIKALQMWADLRPEVVKSLTSGQVNQARSVADKLHVPENRRNRSPPSASPAPRATIEAMRKLSSASRIPLSRGLDRAESDHSDIGNRMMAVTSTDTASLNTPLKRAGGNPLGSSAPAGASPEAQSKANILPSVTHEGEEVTGEEALRARTEDSSVPASSLAGREASSHPIALGERTISDYPASVTDRRHSSGEQEIDLIDSGQNAGPSEGIPRGETADECHNAAPSYEKADSDSTAPREQPGKHRS